MTKDMSEFEKALNSADTIQIKDSLTVFAEGIGHLSRELLDQGLPPELTDWIIQEYVKKIFAPNFPSIFGGGWTFNEDTE